MLQLWRAPLDNDKPFLPLWRAAGLHELARRPIRLDLADEPGGRVVQLARWHRADGSPVAEEQVAWSIHERGVDLEISFTPLADLPSLPRIGVVMELDPSLDRVEWYGRGPHETLCDRLLGAPIGRYEATIDDLQVPYVMPQENGTRDQVRWLVLRDRGGVDVLRLTAPRPFTFAARRWSSEDLTVATHLHELRPRDGALLYLDAEHAGTGNTSLRAERLPKYQVHSRPLTWQLSLRAD